MDELWEQIKKMSRAEQLALADHIYALPDEPELSQGEEELLKSRAQKAKQNDFPGRSADDVLTDLEND